MAKSISLTDSLQAIVNLSLADIKGFDVGCEADMPYFAYFSETKKVIMLVNVIIHDQRNPFKSLVQNHFKPLKKNSYETQIGFCFYGVKPGRGFQRCYQEILCGGFEGIIYELHQRRNNLSFLLENFVIPGKLPWLGSKDEEDWRNLKFSATSVTVFSPENLTSIPKYRFIVTQQISR